VCRSSLREQKPHAGHPLKIAFFYQDKKEKTYPAKRGKLTNKKFPAAKPHEKTFLSF
jgi:hypothetical protein